MATNYAHASYTEVIDLQTTPDKTTIIGVHTPVGKAPYFKLKGFFTQFRKFRYKGISRIVTAPASALPVDPLGLTVQQGSVDAMSPRDTFNPILFKGCHGESMNAVINTLFGADEYVEADGYNRLDVDTDDLVSDRGATSSVRVADFSNIVEDHYYKWLTDTTWKKFGIQQPIRIKNLYPLVWKMARNHPLVPAMNGAGVFVTNAGLLEPSGPNSSGLNVNSNPVTSSNARTSDVAFSPIGQVPNAGVPHSTGGTANRQYVQEFTNGCTRLGWLPTTTATQGESVLRITGLPKLMMAVFVLPPCYNVQQFQRMVIRHEFEFKDFTSSLGAMDYNVTPPTALATSSEATGYYNSIDYVDSDGAKILKEGPTIDMLNGESQQVSDGVA